MTRAGPNGKLTGTEVGHRSLFPQSERTERHEQDGHERFRHAEREGEPGREELTATDRVTPARRTARAGHLVPIASIRSSVLPALLGEPLGEHLGVTHVRHDTLAPVRVLRMRQRRRAGLGRPAEGPLRQRARLGFFHVAQSLDQRLKALNIATATEEELGGR